jgi:hypothetical protein
VFLDAIKSVAVSQVIPGVQDWGEGILEKAEDAKTFGNLKNDPVSVDGVAYFMGYSDEATSPPLYADMNGKAYDKDRGKFTPYMQYMVGMVKHMKAVEPYPNKQVFRGVKADLRDQYPTGRKVTWHGFCSTTKSAAVLQNPQFFGKQGKRTIFAIQLTQSQGREITRYSLMPKEDEILLPPGCRFEVISVLEADKEGDLTLIQLEELPSRDWIIDLNEGGNPPAPLSPSPASPPIPPSPTFSALPVEFATEIVQLQQAAMAAMQAGDFTKSSELSLKMNKVQAAGKAAVQKQEAEDTAANIELDRLVSAGNERLAALLDANTAISKSKSDLEQRKLAALAEVSASFAEIRKAVDTAENDAQDKITEGCAKKGAALHQQEQSLEAIAESIGNATAVLTQLRQSSSDRPTLHLAGAEATELKQEIDIAALVPCEDATVVVHLSETQQLLAAIQKCCEVSTPSAKYGKFSIGACTAPPPAPPAAPPAAAAGLFGGVAAAPETPAGHFFGAALAEASPGLFDMAANPFGGIAPAPTDASPTSNFFGGSPFEAAPFGAAPPADPAAASPAGLFDMAAMAGTPGDSPAAPAGSLFG